jgi:hypothetical protein
MLLAGIAAFSVILYVCKTMRMKTSLIPWIEKQILY